MYTSKEVQKLLDYYSDKVIGKPLSLELEETLIETISIVELTNQRFNIHCCNNSKRPATYSHITTVAKNLDLLSPDEVLNDPPAKN